MRRFKRCNCYNSPNKNQNFANEYFPNQAINNPMPLNNCCPKTTVTNCAPIVTNSKNIINEYHIVKQPYVHNYHTEIVHHHIKEQEFIPTYTCSEVHINENNQNQF